MSSRDNSPAASGKAEADMANEEFSTARVSPRLKSESSEGEGAENGGGKGVQNIPAVAGDRDGRSPLGASSSSSDTEPRQRDRDRHHRRSPRRGSRDSSSSVSSCSTCTSRAGSQTSTSSVSRPERRRGRRSSISSISSTSSSSSSASSVSTSRSPERRATGVGLHKRRADRLPLHSPARQRSATPPEPKPKKPLRAHPHSAPATPVIPLTITDQTDASRKGLAQNLRTTHSVLIQFGLVNSDGQPFPISAENLASYIDIQAERMRRGAIQFSSLNWYLHSMRKLHNENNWEWDAVRKAPIVTKAWNAAKALTVEAATVRATKRASKANHIREQMAATESQKAAGAAQLKNIAPSGTSTPVASTGDLKRSSGEQFPDSPAARDGTATAHGRAIDFSGRNPSMILDTESESAAGGRKRTYSHHSAGTVNESDQHNQNSVRPGSGMAGSPHVLDGRGKAGSVEPTSGKRQRRESVPPQSHYVQLQHQQNLARQVTQQQSLSHSVHNQHLTPSGQPLTGGRPALSASAMSLSDADIDDIIHEARTQLDRWNREQQHRHAAALSRQQHLHAPIQLHSHHQHNPHHAPHYSHHSYAPPAAHPPPSFPHYPPQPSADQSSQPPISEDRQQHHDSNKRRWHYYHPHQHRSDPPTRPPEHSVQSQGPLIFLPPVDTYPGQFGQHLQPIAPRPVSAAGPGGDPGKATAAGPPVLTARQKTAATRKKNAAAKKAAAAEVAAATAAAASGAAPMMVDLVTEGSPA
ncbi:hypothetical protein HDU88_006589 [Geranomyces variabilis]|nr:hypothetical protein HDU88_006589 [Geranomyces variabilis]